VITWRGRLRLVLCYGKSMDLLVSINLTYLRHVGIRWLESRISHHRREGLVLRRHSERRRHLVRKWRLNLGIEAWVCDRHVLGLRNPGLLLGAPERGILISRIETVRSPPLPASLPLSKT
jgi:hypothetical protein